VLGLFSAALIFAARPARRLAPEGSVPEPVQTGPGLKP
jgi:hypothetical protein